MKAKIIFWVISTIVLEHCIDVDAKIGCVCGVPSKDAAKPPKQGTANSVSDFGDLTRCTTFVDKTMMIEAFFNNTATGQYHLITAPHKFGKTTNLNMLKRFVEVTVNSQGEELEKEKAGTYAMFTDETYPLKIGSFLKNENELYVEHFHSYPVVHVSFKDELSTTYDDIVHGLRENIQTCFEGYEWLYRELKEKCKSDEDAFPTLSKQIEIMRTILDGDSDEDDLVNSLFELARILFDVFNYRHVVVLIDDYDSPVLNAVQHNLNVTRVNNLMERLFTKLFNPDHRYIKYAVLTGTANVLSKSKFSHIKHWNFLDDHDFVKYYGFTDQEVDKVLKRHEFDDNEQLQVKDYYGGYLSYHSAVGIYNPYSISRYVCQREPSKNHIVFENFWPEAGQVASSLQRFRRIKKYADILLQLLVSKKITFHLFTNFYVDELNELRRMMHEEKLPLTDYHADLFLSYLFANGYLSHTDVQNIYTIPSSEVENYVNHLLMKTHKRELANSKEIRNKLDHEPLSFYKRIWNKLFGK